jgi:hypothetical protein
MDPLLERVMDHAETSLAQALRAIRAALEAHADEPRCRDILERSRGNRGSETIGVAICEGESGRAREHWEIRICGSVLEVVSSGHVEGPTDWRVSVDELRRIAERGEACLDAPEGLDLRWLETRIGIRPRTKAEPRVRTRRRSASQSPAAAGA